MAKTKMTDLEQAAEYERLAKQLRLKDRKEKEETQRKISEDLGKIIIKIIGRPFVEADIEKFRGYANGIGRKYICSAMNTTTSATPTQPSAEQQSPAVPDTPTPAANIPD